MEFGTCKQVYEVIKLQENVTVQMKNKTKEETEIRLDALFKMVSRTVGVKMEGCKVSEYRLCVDKECTKMIEQNPIVRLTDTSVVFKSI